MAKAIKYYIVAADALPEIFVKVAEAKRMMQTGEVDTVGAATKLAGISRYSGGIWWFYPIGQFLLQLFL